jgi:hypothetical protein
LFASAIPSAAIEAQGPSLERAATGEADIFGAGLLQNILRPLD